MSNIKTISYNKCYNEDIKNLIINEWFIEYPFNKKVINKYATGYLYMYLAKSNYLKLVVNDDNKVIGFIFAKIGKVSFFNTLKYNLKLFFSCFGLLFTKEGRRGLKINRITNKTNKVLFKDYKKTYFNCIELLIVDKNTRGLGIGSSIVKELESFIKTSNNLPIYLFSDTYSNFNFYLHKGYTLLKELDVDFKVEGEDPSKYCIIGKIL